MLSTWALYFALTLLMELPVAACLAPREARGRTVLAAALASLLTHPLLTLVVWEYAPGPLALVVLEVAVAAIETVALRAAVPLSWGRALLVAGVMNAVSAASSPVWWWLLEA